MFLFFLDCGHIAAQIIAEQMQVQETRTIAAEFSKMESIVPLSSKSELEPVGTIDGSDYGGDEN